MSAFEDKVIMKNYRRLRQKTGFNFSNFVDLVLDEAKAYNCQKGSMCHMDCHWRPLYARYFLSFEHSRIDS